MSAQPFPFTYARAEIPVGTPAGNFIYVPIEQANLPTYVPPLDFTTVTQVWLAVSRQVDGTTAKWICQSLSNVTTNGLIGIYTLAGTPPQASTDTYIASPYFLRPYLVTSLLTIPADVRTLYVVAP